MRTGGRADGRTAGSWWHRSAWAAVLLAALAPSAATAQAADAQALAAYRLTETTLNRFIAASRGLAAVAREQPDTSGENEDDEENNDLSIDEIAAVYDKNPATRRAIANAGLTSREYVIFMLSMFEAGMAAWLVERQGWKSLPPNVARENVLFYQQHKATIDGVTAELRERSP